MADAPEMPPPCPCCDDRIAKGRAFKIPGNMRDVACTTCLPATPLKADGPALLSQFLDTAASTVRLRWDLTVPEVEALTDALIGHSKTLLDAAAAAETKTWDTVIGPLVQEDAEWRVIESSLTFPGHVSTDKALRDACTDADTKLSAYAVQASSRKDLYESVLAFSETDEAKALAGEKKRYVDKTLLSFRRKGLHLDPSVATQVKNILTRLSELGINFSKNLGEEKTEFEFTAEQLDGMPEDFLQGRRVSDTDDKYTLTLKYPDYIPLMERCKVAETRRKMEAAFNSRCKDENTAILEELITLRHQKAELMGYPTHAAFITEDRMSGSSETVKNFLSELAAKLHPLLQSDLALLADLKKDEGDDTPLQGWDRSYYQRMLQETKYQVDHETLKQYFPLDVVTSGLLDIYQELLGLTFTREAELERSSWHEDVKAYRVNDTESGELVGFFYMDMHPRQGKYGHAACFGLQPGCKTGSGWQHPVAAAVCNFPKPTGDKPSLLDHGDVETFFHEFGHVMHQLCSKAELAMFAGTSVERDFVEAPSQMLENWCWKPDSLRRMSRHHQTGEPIPDDLMAALIASRNANSGVLNMRQVCLASFDQAIHTAEKADTAEVLSRLSDELMTIPTTPGTNMGATFGHMGGGYDAQYYGYMWSEVYSADMFASRFEKEGIFNSKTGKSYREEVLAVGGSRDAMDSLKAFLGRDPIQEPFLKSKGLVI